jgi:hypothetical protein
MGEILDRYEPLGDSYADLRATMRKAITPSVKHRATRPVQLAGWHSMLWEPVFKRLSGHALPHGALNKVPWWIKRSGYAFRYVILNEVKDLLFLWMGKQILRVRSG